mgnify:CR=1 FL=1
MSIGIATISRNAGPFLEKAVESVLSSNYQNLRYVVQDCNSTDGSTAFVHSIQDPRLIFQAEHDFGPADGLNRAFGALVDCDVVGWLNSDDLLLPGSIDFIAKQFADEPELMVLQGAGVIIDERGTVVGHYSPRRYSPRLARLRVTSMFQPSLYLRNFVIEYPPFNPKNRSCWDSELLYSVASRGCKVRRAQRPLAAFRLHPSSISGSGRLTEVYREEEAGFLGDPPIPTPLTRGLSAVMWLEARLSSLAHTQHVS